MGLVGSFCEPRVGIANSGEAKDYPWRFWITGNPFVSKYKP